MDQVLTHPVVLAIDFHHLNTCWFPWSARRLVPGAGVQPDAALLGGVHDRTPVGPLPGAARLRLQQAVRPGSPLLQGQQQGGLTGRHTHTHTLYKLTNKLKYKLSLSLSLSLSSGRGRQPRGQREVVVHGAAPSQETPGAPQWTH